MSTPSPRDDAITADGLERLKAELEELETTGRTVISSDRYDRGYGEIGEEGSASYRRASGALLSIFNDRLKDRERFVGVRIDDKEDVYPALKQFFGRRGVETPN